MPKRGAGILIGLVGVVGILAARPETGPGTTNRRAYEAFLQGRWHWSKRDQAGFEQASRYFKEAIAADSGFA